MARIAFGCTLGQSLGVGLFNTSSGAATPILGAATAADTAVADVQALVEAVTDAQAAAELDATISGNPTALGLVEDIGTAFTALTDALTLAKAATAAAATAGAARNVVLDIDTAVVTTRNGVKAAVREIMRSVEGSGLAP